MTLDTSALLKLIIRYGFCLFPNKTVVTVLAPSCAHCGTQGVALKRCARCLQTSYCGAACQKAGWKGHKKTCAPQLPLGEVREILNAANAADDWQGVLKWEGRREEPLSGRTDDSCNWVLHAFARAHALGRSSMPTSGSIDHSLSVIRLQELRLELLSASGTKAWRYAP